MTDHIQAPAVKDPLTHLYHERPDLLGQEILARLQAHDVAPTPEAYRALYEELSGIPIAAAEDKQPMPALESRFRDMTRRLARHSNEAGMRLAYCIETGDWDGLLENIAALVDASAHKQAQRSRFADFAEPREGRQWQELLAKVLIHTMPALLQDQPEIAVEAGTLGNQVKEAGIEEMQKLVRSVNELCYRISLVTEDEFGRQKAFLRLLNLTLDSLSEVIVSDEQVAHEVKNFQKIVNEPWNKKTLDRAAKQLKSIVGTQRICGLSY